MYGKENLLDVNDKLKQSYRRNVGYIYLNENYNNRQRGASHDVLKSFIFFRKVAFNDFIALIKK